MKLHKRIIALFLALAMISSLFVIPAFAIEPGGGGSSGGGAGRSDLFTWSNGFAGGKFGGGAGRVESNTAYTDYVTALPASGYSKDGSLLWLCPYAYSSLTHYGSGKLYCAQYSPAAHMSDVGAAIWSMVWSDSSCSFSGSTISGDSYSPYFGVAFRGSAPIDGSYTLCANSFPFIYSTDSSVNLSGFIGCNLASSSRVYTRGESLAYNIEGKFSCKIFSAGPFSGLLYKIVPVFSQSALYPTDTRTGSLSGNFGYTGPDGTMITAENIKIVNETTNTLFNPVTNTTTNFKDWTYDYSTRTYDITLDTGTKQTITYGDENVTIKEGDTIYNIYYVTPDTPPTPPVTCKHDYIPAVTTAATCIAPGVKTYTCSKCKDSYIEKIPATGHSWIVKETVKTTYDATGALLVQGYTIWKCSICGEEYKSTDGAAPPGGGSSGGEVTTKEGFLSKLWGILLSFAVGLSSLFNFLFGAEGQSNLDFYTKPSTFSGVDIWV